MAEDKCKYDLLLVKPMDRKIRNQPWWKERLHTKYIKSIGPNDTSQFLQGRNWIFLKDGLDDFRNGLPPSVKGDMVINNYRGLGPAVHSKEYNPLLVKMPATKRNFSKHEVCFAKKTPLQQKRLDRVNEAESGLLSHPLSLFSHLQESLPPGIFKDVVDILDRDLELVDNDFDKSTQATSSSGQNDLEGSSSSLIEFLKNAYRFLPKEDEKEKEAKEMQIISVSQDEHIKQVTKEFCEWVAQIGGDENNIDETTIANLFASDYNTKPDLSVPIKILELTNIPPELRTSGESNTKGPQIQQDLNKSSEYMTMNKSDSSSKFRYGAWYLRPKTWKKRSVLEPLEDPKLIKSRQMSKTKRRSNDLDSELAAMHGSTAFVKFVDQNASRRPEFLDRVAKLQAKMELEEKERQLKDLKKAQKFRKMTMM